MMFAGLLCLPRANPFVFLKKWIPVNNLLKKVPALLNSISLFNLNDKSSLRRCALMAGGLKLPANLKSAIESDAEICERAERIGEEMGIWGNAPEPFVTGQMLLDMGFRSGPRLGEVIKRYFEMQLDGKIASREEAVRLLEGRG
jgi:tRNA nucleotidyltransferase (CCA-adding enzyme)